MLWCGVAVSYPRRLEILTICRCQSAAKTALSPWLHFKTLSVGLARNWTQGYHFDVCYSTNWTNQSVQWTVNCNLFSGICLPAEHEGVHYIRTRWNGSVSSRLNWNLKVLVFNERGKPKYLDKNLLEQGREPTTNPTHIWRRRQDLNPGHIGGRRVLSPLHHRCSRVAREKGRSLGRKVSNPEQLPLR